MSGDNQSQEQYGVLLYYKYSTIPDLNSLFTFYESNCSQLGLLGRVRLAPHGVNVTELVTFSSHPLLNPPDVSNAGRHLSAVEFHSILQSTGQVLDKENATDDKKLVLLDARNLYETRIGKFRTPSVETLDPEIRQFSDLPTWIDNNAEQLQGKHVLMYCTGGIRCEMASAYVRSKGAGFENVFQLYGGIQRYLEQFPDGGFFKGKNFVFDHRISVGSSDADIMGSCLLCGSSFDDYSSRCRCTHCRMLVLVCDTCRMEGAQYVCELCRKHGKSIGSSPVSEDSKMKVTSPQIELKNVSSESTVSPQMPWRNGIVCRRKLRILCLHGFRQNASSFKGRTASLAKKLKNIAEFVFIDAPHELPFIYQTSNVSSAIQNGPPPPSENCKKRFAWFVAPDFSGKRETNWKLADGPFDPHQYQQQTDGLDVSLAYLKTIFSQEGPFDGILGFSQGAAMAASVCAQWERLKGEIDFRFAILCSGFALHSAEFEHRSINCPSLHIFGGDLGNDRQVANQASKELAKAFEEGCSVIIEHDCGHIIPTRSPYIDEIKSFLQRFL
ncbi:hypothetical protein CUMW_223460 [Citrus unshiu]|uniref:Rhodanese domain-containing protein n=1 Tax=Citrus unshiu TaxID=55188 RepID=A0A2H5QEV4_CITUN|nr:hypothetical protein CUMW_223460 [Citrus unshiu]